MQLLTVVVFRTATAATAAEARMELTFRGRDGGCGFFGALAGTCDGAARLLGGDRGGRGRGPGKSGLLQLWEPR